MAFLTTTLVAIDITLAGLLWAMSENTNVIAQLIKKVLYVGAFALILNNFSSLANIIFNSFAALGLKASGSSLTAADLVRPGFVAATGFDAPRPAFFRLRRSEVCSPNYSFCVCCIRGISLKKQRSRHGMVRKVLIRISFSAIQLWR